MKLFLALVQYDIKTNDPMQNIKKIRSLIVKNNHKEEEKVEERIFFLPELFTAGFGDFVNIRDSAIDFLSPSELATKQIHEMKQLAKDFNATFFGSVPEKENDILFNSCLKISSNKIEVIYRKIHLFGPMDEPKFFSAGINLKNLEHNLINIGTQICYDLRFPEGARYLSSNNAHLIFYPANWPSIRGNHWDQLLKARAIENQCYIIGVNRMGSDKWGDYYGHSQLISPMGEEVIVVGNDELCLSNVLDIKKNISTARSRFNVHEDRRIQINLSRE